ncbi:hypothetical protein H0N98_04590 [Candidatus Micrarchaeota archaeon]|nr:hypothetical protein [Candidatus Micrarchaeota archaeon]
MVDAIGVIQDSYELYKENWRKVITAFIVLFLFALILGVVNILSRFVVDTICQAANNAVLVLLFCISPLILQVVLGLLGGLLNNVITIAVIKPMDEIIGKKTVSDWTKHFFPQLFNVIKVMVVRGLVSLIIFTPLVLVALGSIPALIALKGNINPALLLGGGILLILIVGVISVIVWSIVMFLLTFLEVEIVLGGRGIFGAMSRSIRLVMSNLWDVFVFSILWFLIRMGVGVLNLMLMCTICLIPLTFVTIPFIVEPVELMSKVVLWRKLNKSS